MKSLLALLLLGFPVFAQTTPATIAIAPGCGAEDCKFDVKTDSGGRRIWAGRNGMT